MKSKNKIFLPIPDGVTTPLPNEVSREGQVGGSASIFRFRQFSVCHDRCAMKVGTDGVLLGAWASVDGALNALDVGTGSGLIALMLAQRNSELRVTGVDIDHDAVAQAKENFLRSPFASRLTTVEADFTEPFPYDNKYDVIVSNPPFYVEEFHSPDSRRNQARSESSLPFATLIDRAAVLLSPLGRLDLVVPTSAVPDIVLSASVHGLHLLRRNDVHTTERKPPKRTLLEFSRSDEPSLCSRLIIHDTSGGYSFQYRQLTQDFYL